MYETVKTGLFVAAAVALAVVAAVVEPERARPGILSDQGQEFYPAFTDAQAVRSIEVVDYDEATATARPFQVELQKGRWILPANHNYQVDASDRLVKTAAALMDLRKDVVRSDNPAEHGSLGVIDPLDQKSASLAGRGKRVTLRGARKEVLADFILGKPVEGKAGWRYVRVPGQKRTYAVKTEADASARFADWVKSGLLRISPASLRRIAINSYSINEQLGRVDTLDSVTLQKEGDQWMATDGGKTNASAVSGLISALDSLRIVDVRPKPPELASDLKQGTIRLSLESAMALRQRGFFLTPTGRMLANEGELMADTVNGVVYTLRFGEVVSTEGDSRYLFVTTAFDAQRAAKYGGDAAAGERLARESSNRFADWFYVISGADFQKLRLKRKDLVR